MMKTNLKPVAVLLVSLLAVSIAFADIQEMEWKDVSSGISVTGLHLLAVSPIDSKVAYAGSYKVVYRTSDNGKTWAEVLSFRGTDNGVNTLAADPFNMKVIYAGTADGLYKSSDQGLSWEKIFKGMGRSENMVLAVFINTGKPGNIFIGTQAGIFFTEDSGTSWEKAQNLPSDVAVTSISADTRDPRGLYAASVRGIYKSTDSGDVWKRIHETALDENNLYNFVIDDEEAAEDVDMAGMRDSAHIRKILADPANKETIYAATSKGLLVTKDSGIIWTLSGSIGLAGHNIRDIAVNSKDPEHVYAATDRGIFRYSSKSDSWVELYKGITSSDIRCLAFTLAEHSGPVLWAVTKTGVYRSSHSLSAAVSQHPGPQFAGAEARDVLGMFDYEPSIEEIKEAAIEYAEVSPDKIRKWRRAAGVASGFKRELRQGRRLAKQLLFLQHER
ncbi:MAG: hypothetical protein HZC49_02060 [Nitrospirae bacterium]|nr:hypothetical protein [Nitrospirota bacterium]